MQSAVMKRGKRTRGDIGNGQGNLTYLVCPHHIWFSSSDRSSKQLQPLAFWPAGEMDRRRPEMPPFPFHLIHGGHDAAAGDEAAVAGAVDSGDAGDDGVRPGPSSLRLQRSEDCALQSL